MLSREDAIIGKRVKWISSDTRLSPTPGTITDVTDRGEGQSFCLMMARTAAPSSITPPRPFTPRSQTKGRRECLPILLTIV